MTFLSAEIYIFKEKRYEMIAYWHSQRRYWQFLSFSKMAFLSWLKIWAENLILLLLTIYSLWDVKS